MQLNLITLAQQGVFQRKNHEVRLITDLRHLNKYCRVPRFRNDDSRDASRLVIPGVKFVTVDIKDGFCHIKVAPEINIPKLDPIKTVENYIARTNVHMGLSGPVFMFLKASFSVLGASSIARILDESIALPGLVE